MLNERIANNKTRVASAPYIKLHMPLISSHFVPSSPSAIILTAANRRPRPTAATMRLATNIAIAALAIIPAAASSPGSQIPLARKSESGGTEGSILTYPIPGCSDESIMGGGETWSLPPDDCLKVSTSTSFRILEPAICPNGTRAKLARYEGRDCNYGEVTINGGLVDVTDDDLNTCQYISVDGHRDNATHASIASFGFYCEGKKGEIPKERPGSTSENTCPRGRDPPVSSPSYDHLSPGQCMAILTTERLDIFRKATCSDGSEAKLAKWYGDRMCRGDYDEVVEVTEEMMEECFFINQEQHSSWSWWCPDSGAARLSVGLGALVGLRLLLLW